MGILCFRRPKMRFTLLLLLVLSKKGFSEDKLEDLKPVSAALVSGQTAVKGEHPWHVGLVREESKTGIIGWLSHLGGLIRTTTYCGATLVSRRWLVTAAHCIKSDDVPSNLRVVMGTSKRARFFYYFFQVKICQFILCTYKKNDHQNFLTLSHQSLMLRSSVYLF